MDSLDSLDAAVGTKAVPRGRMGFDRRPDSFLATTHESSSEYASRLDQTLSLFVQSGYALDQRRPPCSTPTHVTSIADRMPAASATTMLGPHGLEEVGPLDRPEELYEVRIHGHRVCFRLTGSGPLIVLVHGITGRSEQWVPVMEALRDRYRSSPRTSWGTASPRSPAATTHSGPTPRGSGTC